MVGEANILFGDLKAQSITQNFEQTLWVELQSQPR